MIRRLLLAAACVFSVLSLRAADSTPEPTPPPKIVQAAATDEVKALSGQTATVEGKVGRIGSTSSGSITFINMATGPDAFVAVVFKSDAAKFPNGFDQYKDQTIRVTGPIALYKETTPQIVVKSPEQIKIVPAAEPTPTPAEQ